MFTLSGSPCAAGVPLHGNRLCVPNDVVEVCDGALELPTVDGLGGLAGVLEGDTEVGATGASGFGGGNATLGGCVADLDEVERALAMRIGRVEWMQLERIEMKDWWRY